jgi:high-affinity nickel-transport protein
MALVDTADSVLMVSAYRWAFVDPLRKLWYNLTITGASVVVALFIGGIEALGLIGQRLELDGTVWRLVESLNASLASFGFAVIALFALAWLLSILCYRAVIGRAGSTTRGGYGIASPRQCASNAPGRIFTAAGGKQ